MVPSVSQANSYSDCIAYPDKCADRGAETNGGTFQYAQCNSETDETEPSLVVVLAVLVITW